MARSGLPLRGVASFIPLCPWLPAILDSKPLPEVHFWLLLHWLGPTWSSRCEGECGGRGCGYGRPPPWGSLRNEHFIVLCPVPAFSVYLSLHPAAGTILMTLCRWGGKDPGSGLPRWLSGSWKPGPQPWQQAAPGACRHESQEQMLSRSTRGNSSWEVCRLGLARPQTLPPHHPATSHSAPAGG